MRHFTTVCQHRAAWLWPARLLCKLNSNLILPFTNPSRENKGPALIAESIKRLFGRAFSRVRLLTKWCLFIYGLLSMLFDNYRDVCCMIALKCISLTLEILLRRLHSTTTSSHLALSRHEKKLVSIFRVCAADRIDSLAFGLTFVFVLHLAFVSSSLL